MSGRGNILVVDDDDDTRTCVMGVLDSEGYSVRGASNGQIALTILRSGFTPHLVLLDLMMPIMSGWEVLDEMAKVPKLATLPVVVFTAAGDLVPAKLTKPVVRKPIEIDALLRMVNDFCAVAVGLDDPPSDLLPKRGGKSGKP
jgi:CheY-like chemotaxis protein